MGDLIDPQPTWAVAPKTDGKGNWYAEYVYHGRNGYECVHDCVLLAPDGMVPIDIEGNWYWIKIDERKVNCGIG